MPSQADYTHHEASLVPEGLRAYRHFTAEPVGFDDYLLTPMGQGGAYLPQCSPYEAQCRRGVTFNPPEPHDPPGPRCKCGFYASYDPDTDFYPTSLWGRNEHGDSGGTFYVRTVVEMSGRTVMGTKGVRAQKMKIVAVAVDWSKFVWHDEGDGVTYGEAWPLDWNPSYSQRTMVPRPRRTPDDEEIARYEALASTLAYTYGAKYYPTVLAMHENHPKPDIDHLKPTIGSETRDSRRPATRFA